MPTCPICSKEMQNINHNHLKAHNLTTKQFKELYPNVETHSQELREKNKQNSAKGKIGSRLCKSKQYNKRLEKYNLNPKRCLKCECAIPYDKRENKFCSNSCAATMNNKTRKVNYSEDALTKLRENALKNQAIISKKRVKGYAHKGKDCEICHKSFLIYWRTKNKKTCSDDCLKLLRGINNSKRDIKTFGNCGYYKGVYCASSWELAFLIYNLDLGKNIQRCDLYFSYIIEEEEKTYFPDFTIEDKIYEVKGRELDDVAFKTQAVVDAGYEIELIRKKEITPIIKFLKEKYGVKDLTELYDKK